jgi:hypothetical protein
MAAKPDSLFPDYDVVPVSKAPRDGTVVMLRGSHDYAAAHWGDGGWRLGRPENQHKPPLHFRPRHWLRKP